MGVPYFASLNVATLASIQLSSFTYAFKSLECLNWQSLNHMQIISFRDDAQ